MAKDYADSKSFDEIVVPTSNGTNTFRVNSIIKLVCKNKDTVEYFYLTKIKYTANKWSGFYKLWGYALYATEVDKLVSLLGTFGDAEMDSIYQLLNCFSNQKSIIEYDAVSQKDADSGVKPIKIDKYSRVVSEYYGTRLMNIAKFKRNLNS